MMIAAPLPPAALVFDLDGTLVDSLPDMLAAFNRLLADLARPPVEADLFRTWVGDGARVLIERGLTATGGIPEPGVSAMVTAYLAHYRGHAAEHSQAFPGVHAVLEHLHAGGHALAVCTNKPADLAHEVLHGLGLARFFSTVLGGDSLPVRKPDPDHVRATLTALAAGDRPAVMIGDSQNDLLAGRGLGLPVVLVSFGYGPVAADQLGADLVIDDFHALPQALATVLGCATGVA